jgi:hypothetical protein
VSIDPDTGEHQTAESPIATEDAAWAMAIGPDGKLYLGTAPNAYFLRLDTLTNRLSVIGQPAPTEKFIWQIAIGIDRKLYACTYPSAKLLRLDVATDKVEDLGRMDPREEYARFIAASDDGFVYVGIGSGKSKVVAYEIATGRFSNVLPERYQVRGFAQVLRGDDGKVYGTAAGQDFRFDGWAAVAISRSELRRDRRNALSDGRIFVSASGGVIRLRDPRSGKEFQAPFRYAGKELPIFRLGLGPDRMIYGSGVLPAHLFSVDPRGGEVKTIGTFGEGEFYSLMRYSDVLLGGAYAGVAPLMVYDPRLPLSPGKGGSGANPRLVHFDGEVAAWRPEAMIVGPDQRVYVGAVGGYGESGGRLAVWNVESGSVKAFGDVVKNQSVVSLTAAGGHVVGGTSIRGGGGSHTTESEARLFVWDTTLQRKIAEVVPVRGAQRVSNLVTASNGLVFGIAADTLFVFDVTLRQVVHTRALPFRGAISNSISLGGDGVIRGLASEGVYAIDPASKTATLIARSPERITAGFAADSGHLYFACGTKLYRFTTGSR